MIAGIVAVLVMPLREECSYLATLRRSMNDAACPHLIRKDEEVC